MAPQSCDLKTPYGLLPAWLLVMTTSIFANMEMDSFLEFGGFEDEPLRWKWQGRHRDVSRTGLDYWHQSLEWQKNGLRWQSDWNGVSLAHRRLHWSSPLFALSLGHVSSSPSRFGLEFINHGRYTDISTPAYGFVAAPQEGNASLWTNLALPQSPLLNGVSGSWSGSSRLFFFMASWNRVRWGSADSLPVLDRGFATLGSRFGDQNDWMSFQFLAFRQEQERVAQTQIGMTAVEWGLAAIGMTWDAGWQVRRMPQAHPTRHWMDGYAHARWKSAHRGGMRSELEGFWVGQDWHWPLSPAWQSLEDEFTVSDTLPTHSEEARPETGEWRASYRWKSPDFGSPSKEDWRRGFHMQGRLFYRSRLLTSGEKSRSDWELHWQKNRVHGVQAIRLRWFGSDAFHADPKWERPWRWVWKPRAPGSSSSIRNRSHDLQLGLQAGDLHWPTDFWVEGKGPYQSGYPLRYRIWGHGSNHEQGWTIGLSLAVNGG